MRIDIWSDLVCPWCWIGKHRLQRGLASLQKGNSEIELHWHPYMLDPEANTTPTPLREFYANKFGGAERAGQMLAQTQATAQAEGLPMDFDLGQVRVSTMPAHRLMWLASREGDVEAVGEALFRAHFAEGRNLADLETLIHAGISGGLQEARIRALFASEEGVKEVQAQLGQAQAMGIQAVPTFVIDGRYAVQGAQTADVFAEVISKILHEQAVPSGSAGDECGPEGCQI